MALNALLKFTQGALIGVDGQSLVVAGGAPVTVGNSTGATDVGSWTIELLYAPPGSALFTLVPVMEAAGGATAPLWVFSPDVGIYGLYRIRLTVYSGPGYTGSKDVDIRNVGVVTPNRKFLVFSPQIDPPPLPLTGIGAKPHEFNFNGQPFGWAGDNEPTARGLNEALLLLDTLTSFAGVPYNYYTVALTEQTEFILPDVPANGVILLVVNGLVQKPEDYSIVANIVTYLGIPLSGGAGVSVYYWLDGGGGGGGTDLDAVHVNVANEIAVVTEKVTPVGTDVLLIEDSEDSNLKKRIPLSSLPSGLDELVRVSATDTTAGRLNDKLTPGEGLRKSTLNPSGVEQLQVDLPDKTEQLAESALAMDAVADGYFANAFGFDGTYTWVGFREYNEHLGKWVRFNKALNYVERHEYTAGAYSTVAALVFDEARSRMLEVLVYDSGGGSYVAEIITHTLATPSVAGTPVALGAASGGFQTLTVLPAGDYIFVFGLPSGTKRLLATDLTVQVASAIGGYPHRMFYDPTDRYGDGEGRVYTQPANYVYLRWVPSTGANDAFFQPEGEYNSSVPIGIDPTGGRMWAVWEKGTSRNHLGSWDLNTFGDNLRFIAPAGEIGEPALPHDSMFGGIVDGTAAYSIAQQSAPSYCYYVQKFTDSGAAIVEGAQVSDGATSLDAYDPQYLFLNVFNAFRVSLKAGSKMLTLVQSYSSRDWCVRALELSPMADDLEDFEATEIGWAPVARVGGDLSGHGDNPKVTGIGGRNLNAISGAVPGEQLLMPPNSGQSMVFSFTPYTTRVGAHADPTEAVGHPFTGFDVYRTNDDDPLTLQINETAYLHPRTLHLRDVKGNAGHLGSHVTVEPYGTEEIKFGDMGFVSSFLLRSAYEEVVLSSVPGAAPFTGAWQVAERHRLWEGIDVDANLTVKSGYALCKVDSSGGAVMVTLIASPQHDDWCIVKDVVGDAGTYNIVVDGNGETIDGQASKTIAVAYGHLKLRYDAVLGEWVVLGERLSASSSSTYSVIDASLASGANNDVNPTGWAGASAVRLSSPAAAEITGFAAVLSTDVLQRKLYNVGSYDITLKHQSTGSAAANRLIIPGGADLVLTSDDVVDLFYDVTSQRWRIG